MPHLSIRSETGRLRSVLVHRPGPELEHMTPEMREELLFDEILWLPDAQAEHDVFAAALRVAVGAEGLLYIEDLLEEVLADPELRRRLVGEVMALEPGARDDRDALAAELLALPPGPLVTALVAGRQESAPHSLAEFLEDRTLYRPQPIPNLLFTRDPGAVVGDRAVIGSMRKPARRREPLLLRAVFRHHPRFAGGGEAIWWDPFEAQPAAYPDAHLEGGDVLVLGERALLVGCSERTDHQGIDALARRLLREDSPVETIYVALLPARRAWMHLDTVFTFLSPHECVLYPPLLRGYGNEGVRLVELRLSSKGVRVREHTTFLPDLLREREGMDLEVVQCGGDDPLMQDREQWTDGSNLVALAPGVVVGYERNERTWELLSSRLGYEIITLESGRAAPDGSYELCADGAWITEEELARRVALGSGRKVALRVPSGELGRGRGGPRCLTMALERDPL